MLNMEGHMRKKITKIIAVLTVTAVMTGGISSVPGLARTVLNRCRCPI